MLRRTPVLASLLFCAVLGFLVVAGYAPAAAQRREPSVGSESGSSSMPVAPDRVTDTPEDKSQPTPGRGENGGNAGGTGGAGLPDAVTVLGILSALPRFPGLSDGGPDYVPSDEGPPPKGGSAPASERGAPPRRVVTNPPNQPFTPRPRPRPQGTAPVATGAILPEVRDREVIVTLSAGSDANTVYELSQDLGLDGNTLYASALLGVRVVQFRIPDTRTVGDVLQQLATDVRVEGAQPSYVFVASGQETRPASFPVPQYAPEKLHLAEAHKRAQGKRIKVAVIDTAVDTAHPALAGAITETFDALGDSVATPDTHGTAIAGIVGARSDLKGVAPASDVLGVRAFSRAAGGPAQSHTLALLKALDWAVANGARVVNMSFAGPEDPLLGKAIAAAVAKGVVTVAAAGNGGPEAKPAYPAAFPNVIAVTATDYQDAPYKDANRGTYIAVAAPGVDIVSAAPGGAYDVASGTSMAAAHISGITALLLEKKPTMTPADIRAAIAASASKVSGARATDVGAGVANAAEALDAVK